MSCCVMKSPYLRLLVLLRPGHYEGPLRPLQRQLDAVHDKTCQIEYFFSGLMSQSPDWGDRAASTVFFWSGNKIEVISFWILFDLKYSLYLSANLLLAQQEHFFDHCQKEPSLPLSLSLSQTVLSCFKSCIRAADQRPGLASFIWIFQWWKWKFWPPENLIKFSYLSRCSLSWTTYTFCCYVAKTFCPSKNTW